MRLSRTPVQNNSVQILISESLQARLKAIVLTQLGNTASRNCIIFDNYLLLNIQWVKLKAFTQKKSRKRT
ncbi:Exocyst Complex Component 3-Like Protein [Manis pentadactyla]|nr:Exocyst Complex Component 3-Like Protein [Manis pentadactyla]